MDSLFELIKSLSSSEKGYFKKLSTKTEADKNNYLRLFDAIDEQEVYDETLILKKFSKEKFAKQLGVAKHYLQSIILKALVSYHEGNDADMLVNRMLSEIKILSTRGMYVQAEKLLNKAKELCARHEMLPLAIHLYYMEMGFRLRQAITDDKNAGEILNESENLHHALNQYKNYRDLIHKQVLQAHQSFFISSKDVQASAQKIFELPLLQPGQKFYSLKAALTYHDMRGNYFAQNGKWEEAYNEYEQNRLLSLKNKHISTYDPTGLLNNFDALLMCAGYSERWVEFAALLKQLQQLKFESEPDSISAFLIYARFGLIYFDHIGDEKSLMNLVSESYRKVKLFGAKIRKDLHLAVMIANITALLEYGKYSEAVDWVELFKQYPKTEKHQDSQSYILLFQLMAHYELKNELLVNNILQSIEYFLKKAKQKKRVEEISLKFFRELTSKPDTEKRKIAFTAYVNELKSLGSANISEKNMVVQPVLLAFIESKINGKKYHEYLRGNGPD